MQTSSLVVMVEPLILEEIIFLLTRGIKRWPEPNEDVHMVTELKDLSDENASFGIGIALDVYPELRDNDIWLNPELFKEVEAPNVNVHKFTEPS